MIPKNTKEVKKFLKSLRTKPEEFWIKRGEKMALNLFHRMSERVPAYKDFLKKNNVNSKKIKSIKDFGKLPSLDKNNYLRAYPLEELCWDGVFSKGKWTISSTSGSTGEPFYFPRGINQDLQYALSAELYLLSNFSIDKKSTLYINAFPLGPWIGGIFTYEAIRIIAERGKYPLSIYPAGINKKEIIKAVKKFGHHFDQIIIGCYGPFLKDALDDGVREGINWADYNIKYIFAAEVFSEEFRDYVLNLSGTAEVLTSTLNQYGTVDLGTMANETPLSILTRRIAVNNKDYYSRIFKNPNKLPTLAQFIPEMFYFEEVNGGLYCTAESGLPLVRYDLKDHGGVFSLKDLYKMSKENEIGLKHEISQSGIKSTVFNLPFVYVYERSDFSISLYAFQIYPESIRRALQCKDLISLVTGKFTMKVIYNEQMDQSFELNIELKSGMQGSDDLISKIREKITNTLLQENSEYRKTYEEIGKRIEPKIILWPYENVTFFCPGTKQQWVKNDI